MQYKCAPGAWVLTTATTDSARGTFRGKTAALANVDGCRLRLMGVVEVFA